MSLDSSTCHATCYDFSGGVPGRDSIYSTNKMATAAAVCVESCNSGSAVGPTGPAGAVGPQGPTGASGGGLENYGYFYLMTAPPVVGQNAPIPFDTNGIFTPTGFTHVLGSTDITVLVTGTYRISFSVSGVQPNQFGVGVNGALPVEADGTVYGAGAGTEQTTGIVMLNLTANDVVRLINFLSPAGVTVASHGGSVPAVLASILFEQIA